jgi:hypothetical protein
MKKFECFIIGKYKIFNLIFFGIVGIITPGLFAYIVFNYNDYLELSVLKILFISLLITGPITIGFYILCFFKSLAVDTAIEVMGTDNLLEDNTMEVAQFGLILNTLLLLIYAFILSLVLLYLNEFIYTKYTYNFLYSFNFLRPFFKIGMMGIYINSYYLSGLIIFIIKLFKKKSY